MIIFKAFQGLENFYIKFQDFPYFSRICTNPVYSAKVLEESRRMDKDILDKVGSRKRVG